MQNDQDLRTRLEKAVQRHAKLNEKKIGIERDLVRSTEDVERSRKLLVERFGTDDPVRIRDMIEEAKAENLAAMSAFEESLGDVETRLSEIENG